MNETSILDRRRCKLGMPIRVLVKFSRVPEATVKRILANPGRARFDSVAAVGGVLGIDFRTARKVPVGRVLRDRARKKAEYVARLVQGTQGLEASGVDEAGFQRLVDVAAQALLAGKKRKLWDED